MITTIAHRMRNILSLAALWTRRAGAFRHKRNRIAIRLRAFTKLTRKLINRCSGRETLDDHRLQVDFDCPDEAEILYFDCNEDFTFRDEDEMREQQHCDGEGEERNGDFINEDDEIREEQHYEGEGEDEEMNGDWDIDLKAEEFIAKFHEHLRLERQKSFETKDSCRWNATKHQCN